MYKQLSNSNVAQIVVYFRDATNSGFFKNFPVSSFKVSEELKQCRKEISMLM